MNRVVICAIPVKSVYAQEESVKENMPEIRRLRFESVSNPGFRAQLIAAQRAMDGALSALLPDFTPPAEFTYLPGGKPYIRGASVSVAHTSALAVCAVSHIPVGVDVEDAGRVIKPAMKERILYPGEEAPYGLIGAWVDKEAYFKLTGEGISGGMSHFLIRGNDVFAPGGKKLAHIVRLKIAGHLVSVCCYDDFAVEFA